MGEQSSSQQVSVPQPVVSEPIADVEKKKGSLWWVWLILGLFVLSFGILIVF